MIFTIEKDVEKMSERNEEKVLTFKEAMKRTKFGKFQITMIFISGIFMGSAFWETMGINYALPVAECDLGITSKSQYGLISGVWFAGIILTSHSWGFLSDAYGRRKTLIIASLSAFIASILSSVANNLWQMILFRFLNGFFISGSTSIIFAYLGEFLGDKNRSRSMMVSSVIFGACCLALPIMAWLIINQKWQFFIPLLGITYKPWRFFLLACGFPSLFCGISLFFFPESPKFTFSQGNEAKTIKILSRIYKINTGKTDFNILKLKPSEEETNENSKNKNVVSAMFEQTASLCKTYPRSIGIISLLQFLIYFVSNGMLLFFPDILNQTAKFAQESSNTSDVNLCVIVENAIKEHQESFNDFTSSVCIDELEMSSYRYGMTLEVCYMLSFMIISWLVNYTGRLAIFTFISFTTSFCGFAVNYSGTWVGTYLYVWLLGCGINISLLNTVTYDLFPTNLRSLAMSISLMFGRLGSLVGGNIVGFLLDQYCETAFTLSGGVLLAGGILTFLIPNIIRNK
ncbi:hypothetical protein PVAND_015856 [Polypedilum vanderplanki]|uniref:Major facilitator superfamily (MFS) profile domain-containing protein n=1 Tax=Polypedilum vanderplanki TaxID=319348 RepID=A0A9J6BDV3_POLVA|nr:hypothetical protein PVAND_015856 [Polypedilum vanderplanki]